jgi:hypothetical protein
MRKLMMSHARSFPAPIHEGSVSHWHLAPVLERLGAQAVYEIERALIEISRMAMRINVAKESHRLKPPVEERLRALVA